MLRGTTPGRRAGGRPPVALARPVVARPGAVRGRGGVVRAAAEEDGECPPAAAPRVRRRAERLQGSAALQGRRGRGLTRGRPTDPPPDTGFEARLAKLKDVKGETGRGRGVKAERKEAEKKAGALRVPGAAAKAAPVDYSGEKVYYEGPPSVGDLATNVALGFTVLWLPLTLASVGRYLWVEYKITDKRLSIQSKSPINQEQTDVGYDKVEKVVAIGRGLGFWGDMVVQLYGGEKMEFRSINNFQEVKKYIEDRAAEVQATSKKDAIEEKYGSATPPPAKAKSSGFGSS